MKLHEIRDAYYFNSGAASTVTRQATFGAIAVIWVFKIQQGSNFVIPSELVLPLLYFVLSLALDLCHYITGTIIWGVFNRVSERRFGPKYQEDIYVSPVLNWPTLVFFWSKLSAAVVGYVLLMKYAILQLSVGV